MCAQKDESSWWCPLLRRVTAHLLTKVSELRPRLGPAATQAPLEHLQGKGSEHMVRAARPPPRSFLDVWGRQARPRKSSSQHTVHSNSHPAQRTQTLPAATCLRYMRSSIVPHVISLYTTTSRAWPAVKQLANKRC